MTSVPFNIPITDDNVYEGNENFTIFINSSSLPADVIVESPGQATVTIVDDDRKSYATIASLYMYNIVEFSHF